MVKQTPYGNSHAAHGLMFHHFCDAKHPAGQGAITADQLSDILDYAGIHRILTPAIWAEKAAAGRLDPDDLCLTFDDALLCQIEVAVPVLDALDLKAFWFVYSGVFEGSSDNLEIYRHYRTVRFQSVDDFYDAFFATLAQSEYISDFPLIVSNFSGLDYLREFSYYSDNDRLFRYLRDMVLGRQTYYKAMDHMIDNDAFYSRAVASEMLFMKEAHIKDLQANGHEIGLHSYSHPTLLSGLSPQEQRQEYERNADHLQKVLGRSSISMAHPCGSYDDGTLSLLRGLGVQIGFIATMALVEDTLCLPRQDHSYMAMALGMRS